MTEDEVLKTIEDQMLKKRGREEKEEEAEGKEKKKRKISSTLHKPSTRGAMSELSCRSPTPPPPSLV